MNLVDPLPRQISHRCAVIGLRQHIGLEPTHLACGRSLGIDGTTSNDLAHHRIERQTVGVVHILVSGQPTEDRLAQQANQGMQTIVTRPRVSQKPTSNVVQAKHFVKFPEQQQTTVGTDLRAMKFQTHPPIKSEPNITRFPCTL